MIKINLGASIDIKNYFINHDISQFGIKFNNIILDLEVELRKI